MGYTPIELFHGGDTTTPHVGMCVTDDWQAAVAYATDKNASDHVQVIFIDSTGLTVDTVDDVEFRPYEGLRAPGDDVSYNPTGADIICFRDSGMHCEAHWTWRLMTPAAVAATTIESTLNVDNED